MGRENEVKMLSVTFRGQSSSSPVPMALGPLNPLGGIHTLRCQHSGARGGGIFKACLGYIGRTRLKRTTKSFRILALELTASFIRCSPNLFLSCFNVPSKNQQDSVCSLKKAIGVVGTPIPLPKRRTHRAGARWRPPVCYNSGNWGWQRQLF